MRKKLRYRIREIIGELINIKVKFLRPNGEDCQAGDFCMICGYPMFLGDRQKALNQALNAIEGLIEVEKLSMEDIISIINNVCFPKEKNKPIVLLEIGFIKDLAKALHSKI